MQLTIAITPSIEHIWLGVFLPLLTILFFLSSKSQDLIKHIFCHLRYSINSRKKTIKSRTFVGVCIYVNSWNAVGRAWCTIFLFFHFFSLSSVRSQLFYWSNCTNWMYEFNGLNFGFNWPSSFLRNFSTYFIRVDKNDLFAQCAHNHLDCILMKRTYD